MISRHVEAEIEALSRRQSQLKAAQEPPASTTRLQAAQLEYDLAYRALGAAAPPSEPGESLPSYRGRLAAALAPHTDNFRNTDPYLIAHLPAIEQQMRDEVVARANDPHRGQLRKVEVTDEGGVNRVEWRGAQCPLVAMFSTPYQVAISEDPTPPVRRWGGG